MYQLFDYSSLSTCDYGNEKNLELDGALVKLIDFRSCIRLASTGNNMTSGADGTPWVERYRPQTLDDVSHQTEVVSTLKNAVQTGRLPHLLLYGPPGRSVFLFALTLSSRSVIYVCFSIRNGRSVFTHYMYVTTYSSLSLLFILFSCVSAKW